MDEKNRLTEQMPEAIGRYTIQECIGYGAMGAVYKAFDPLIKRTLAIKTIRLDIPRGSPQYRSFIERFYHEARISGTLSHPNIVTLFDIGEEGGLPYLAMEYVEGDTIASLLERGTRFKPETVISLASQIASGLDYAHSKGIIHRDVKPSNLILHEEKVKITDFGIAKLMDAEMTQSGTLLGTPSYMSPEQAMGDKLDGRSDIFSLGVVCFEMLSGEQPFPGNNVTSILYKLVHVDPIEPANLEMNGLVPQKWHEVFGKVLAKKPADRYQTAGGFVRDLEYCLGSWFGALAAEETISEPAPAIEPTVTLRQTPAGAPEGPTPETTVPMPVLDARPGAAGGPPTPAAVATDDSATVVFETPATPGGPTLRGPEEPTPVPADSATVVSKPGAPPPARRAPIRSEVDEETIALPAPPPGAAPAAGSPGTAAPPPPSSAVEATIVLANEELTVKTRGPAPAAPSPKTRTTPETASLPTAPVASRTIPPGGRPQPKAPTLPEASSTVPATRRAVRSGVPASLLVGGAATLFAMTLVVAGIVIWKSRGAPAEPAPPAVEPTPTPAPVPSAAVSSTAVVDTGTLRVETAPPGAAVSINGEARGTTPLELSALPPGSYEVKVELRGYDAQTRTVSITSETPRAEIGLTLARSGPALGTADILSTPFGAAVTVDGSAVGETPLTDLKLRVGTRQVQMTKEGYEPWSGTLAVVAYRKGRLDAALKVKPPPPPPVAQVPDPNRVYDNKTEVDQPAKRLSGSSVSYPDNAPKLRSGDSVSVSVRFVVTVKGEVSDLEVVESGGKILDEAAVSTIRAWKFAPAVKKGTKVKARMTLRFTFRAG